MAATKKLRTALAAWVATRPAIVQQAAARWPLGSAVIINDDEAFMVIGWAETATSERTGDPLDLMLIISRETDVHASYEQMIARSERVCARHLTSPD